MIQIPTDIYSFNLKIYLSSFIHQETEDKTEIKLLHRICTSTLDNVHDDPCESIDTIRLTPSEKDIIQQGSYCTHPNLEVRARCLDVMRYNSKDFADLSIQASDTYLHLFSAEEDNGYLLRSLFVRGKSNISNEYISRFLEISLSHELYPLPLNKIISYLIKLELNKENTQILREYINRRIQEEAEKSSLIQHRGYIQSKYLIGDLSKEEYHRDIALSHETEADRTLANRKPHTFYMGLDQQYKEGLKSILPFKKVYPELYERLWNKLKRQQQHIADMMHKLPPITIQIPERTQKLIRFLIKKKPIASFTDIITLLLEVYQFHVQSLKRLKTNPNQTKYYVSKHFGIAQQDKHGNTVGTEEPENSDKCHLYQINRLGIEFALAVAVNHCMKSDIEITREKIAQMLQTIGSTYIDKNRYALVVEGLFLAFHGEFITASHLLLPQLEHFLHDIDEQLLHKDLTKLLEERQEEYTLERILSDLTKVNEPVFDELSYFLLHGSDVNFRNKMAHGLMEIPEMDRHSLYFCWTCFCLFILIENLLKKEE